MCDGERGREEREREREKEGVGRGLGERGGWICLWMRKKKRMTKFMKPCLSVCLSGLSLKGSGVVARGTVGLWEFCSSNFLVVANF